MDITNLVDCMTTAEMTEFISRDNNESNESNECIKCDDCDDCDNGTDDNNSDDCNDCNGSLYSDDNDNDNEVSGNNRKTCIHYYEEDEIYDEHLANDYHREKSYGNWQYAKMIVSHSYTNANLNTEFFWDYLDTQFQANNDEFNNIIKVYYKNDLDIGIIYEFEPVVAKYLVENLKIQSFKPKGYIFNGDENQNKWEFKIVVITTKGIYTANRYITENTIGCY